jgi:hypothetical protein
VLCSPTFWRNVQLPSSGLKSVPDKHQEANNNLTAECHLGCGTVRVYYKPFRRKFGMPSNCSQSVSNHLKTFPFFRVISSTLKMEATRSSEMSVYNKPTGRHIPEDGIVHSHRRKKPQILKQSDCWLVVTCSSVLYMEELCYPATCVNFKQRTSHHIFIRLFLL